MKVWIYATAALASTCIATAAQAQNVQLGVAGGGVFAVGKLDSAYTSGRSGLITLSVGPQDAVLGARFDYQYDSFKGKTEGGVTQPDFHINSATANVVAPFRIGYAKPYIIGGVGIYPLHIPGTRKETDWGENVGAGLGFPLPGTTIGGFVEVRYHDVNRSNASPYHFVPVTLGILF